MNQALEFLLSAVYDGPTRLDHPDHLADLRKSGHTDDTIRLQRYTDVPPTMLPDLLGFDPKSVVSAYLLPYADPRGGWFDFVRVKVFPPFTGKRGEQVKYLQRRYSGARLYFPRATLAALQTDVPLLVCEGEKKAAAAAQLGIPCVGIAGIDAWHRAGSLELLPDFDYVNLRRTVKVVPDADIQTNPAVARATRRLAEALEARGGRVEVVMLPIATTEAA